MNLTFKTLPAVDGVTVHHSDGLYLYDGGDLKQVVMIGDNMPSPQTVVDAIGDDFIFDGAYMLPGDNDRTEFIGRARGFIGVLLRKRGSKRQFPPGIREHSFLPVGQRESAYESWGGEQALNEAARAEL